MFATLLALAALAPARAGIALTGKPDVHFYAEGNPGALDIDGVAGQFLLQEHEGVYVFRVPVKSVDTGIELRNEHMGGYVHAEEHPFIFLKVPADGIELPAEGKASGVAHATFELAGQEAPVDVKYEVKAVKDGWKVKGEFDFDVTKHGIEIPSYLGVTVEPQMHAVARFQIAEE